MNYSFGKTEKLKSSKSIQELFSDGKSISKYPIRLIYKKTVLPIEHIPFQVGVSASKRNFKKAVDRNFIKRLLREGYRKNKYIINQNATYQYAFMFLYTGKQLPDGVMIEKSMQKILRQFSENVNKENEYSSLENE